MKTFAMAGWAPNNKKLNDVVMGLEISPKSSIDLMQNCDLPPPQKVFSGSDKAIISSMNRIFSMMGREGDNDELDAYRSGGDNEKLELFKALRLSQTRAREAERKAASFAKERDSISNALLEESLRLFAHRQWVRLLEVQVSKLQSQRQRQEKHLCCGCGNSKEGRGLLKEENDCEDGGGVSWIVALTLCFGIVGVGFAFGCRYLF